MKNLQLIEVKYLPATDTLGARTKLTCHRLKESVTLNRDWSVNYTKQVTNHLKERGIKVFGVTETKAGYAMVCTAKDGTFQSITK